LSVVEKRNTTQERTSKWEAELWSHVGSGNGVSCPCCSVCQSRRDYGECPDRHKEQVKGLLGKRDTSLDNFDFITGRSARTVTCKLFQLIEMLASKYIRMGKACSTPVPNRLIALLDKEHPIDVREVTLRSFHGALWHQSDGWVIQLNSRDSASTRRFSLFHEGFHILAHRKTTPVFRKMGRSEGAFNELLAGYFASCILMPRTWVVEQWSRVGNLETMVQLFDVPDSLMYIRLRQFGLLR
jgi:Zn-dependent peptidase ImmA (M78 family)